MDCGARGLKEDRKKVLRNALFMGSGTLTSRILGLFRDVAMGALFDRTITDAWTAAFRIPNLFRRLLGEGALSLSLIPTFIEAQQEPDGGVRAQNFLSSFYCLFLVALAILSLLGIVFIEPIMGAIMASSYQAEVSQWALTLFMGRVMFGFVFFFGTYAYFMGLLNALGRFGVPAFAAGLLNISMLVFTLTPESFFKRPGEGLAWGVLVGGFLQALVVALALRQKGYLPRLRWMGWSEDLKKALKILLPGLIGMGLLQFSTLVNLYFSSFLEQGTLSAIYWADRLLEFPLSLISASIGSALLPLLSQYHSENKEAEFQTSFSQSFLMNLFLALPGAVGLFFLASPIVEVLFLRGKFTTTDLSTTVLVLQVYALALLFISSSRVLLTLFFAQGKARYPAIVTLLCLLIHIGLAPGLMQRGGLQGLMIAGLIGSAVSTLLLLVGAILYGGLKVSGVFLISLAKFLLCGIVLGGVLWGATQWFAAQGAQWWSLLMTIILGMIVYFGMAKILNCSEVSRIRRSSRL